MTRLRSAGALWFSYLFVLFYLAVAAGAVTHADLFLENPVKLPFLNIDLPLLAFFFLAPILFLFAHGYTLMHLVMLTEKAKRYDQALRDRQIGAEVMIRAAQQAQVRQLPSNIFIQYLAGPMPACARAPSARLLGFDRLVDFGRRAGPAAAHDAIAVPAVPLLASSPGASESR